MRGEPLTGATLLDLFRSLLVEDDQRPQRHHGGVVSMLGRWSLASLSPRGARDRLSGATGVGREGVVAAPGDACGGCRAVQPFVALQEAAVVPPVICR